MGQPTIDRVVLQYNVDNEGNEVLENREVHLKALSQDWTGTEMKDVEREITLLEKPLKDRRDVLAKELSKVEQQLKLIDDYVLEKGDGAEKYYNGMQEIDYRNQLEEQRRAREEAEAQSEEEVSK